MLRRTAGLRNSDRHGRLDLRLLLFRSQLGGTRRRIGGPCDRCEEVLEWAHGGLIVEQHRESIEAQVRLGRNAMAIYQELVDTRGFTLIKWVTLIEQPPAAGGSKAIPLLAAARFVREGHLD